MLRVVSDKPRVHPLSKRSAIGVERTEKIAQSKGLRCKMVQPRRLEET